MTKAIFLMIFLISTINDSEANFSTFTAWDKSVITVCFGGKEAKVTFPGIKSGFSSWEKNKKKYIEHIITQEFSNTRTGYSFDGFMDCINTSNPDVIILRKSTFSMTGLEYRGIATIGKTFTIPSPTYPSARGVVVFTSSGMNSPATFVHEFGHILGLMHEHAHPDAKEEARENCSHYQKKSKKLDKYMYSEFDENSVMNYCRIDNDSNAGLSQGDIEHILKLYRYSSVEKMF